MSEFNVEQYVAKWDNIIGPVMMLFIVASIVAVFALNSAASTECNTNEYVYCGEDTAHKDHH